MNRLLPPSFIHPDNGAPEVLHCYRGHLPLVRVQSEEVCTIFKETHYYCVVLPLQLTLDISMKLNEKEA